MQTLPNFSAIPTKYRERFAKFWKGYTQALAFTSSIDSEDGVALFEGSGDFDSNYPDAFEEFGPLLDDSEVAELVADAAGFFMSAKRLIVDRDESAGHDFHMTRTGQGCGFWDGDWEQGDKLTSLSKPYGTCELMGLRDDHGELTYAYLCH